jgi:hypothetical protein
MTLDRLNKITNLNNNPLKINEKPWLIHLISTSMSDLKTP